MATSYLLALVVGYLLGSIPFGLVFTRLAGTQDIRAIGSGNIGATNVLRTGRKGLAAATLLADVLKGTVAVLLMSRGGAAATPASSPALGAFLGHLFPVWLKFKGGKGVATCLGVLLAVSWKAALAAAVIWIAVAAATRYSSVASLVASRGGAGPALVPRHARRSADVPILLAIAHRHHASRQHRAPHAAAPRARSARKPALRARRKVACPHRRAAARLAAADPQRQCRAAHLRAGCCASTAMRAARSKRSPNSPAAAAPRAPSASIRAPTPSARWQRREGSALSLSASAKTAYPQRLAEIDDAPPLLAVRGNLAALTRPMIAMVGSRNASARD